MRWSKPLSFLLSTLAVAILFTMHWIKQTFGEVTYEQIVWHILNVDTLQGFDHNYLRNALTHLVKIIIYSFIIGIFIKYIDITLNKLFGYSQRKIQTFTILASSILFIYSAVSFAIRYIDTDIISYNEKDFIAENYYIPENIVFNKKIISLLFLPSHSRIPLVRTSMKHLISSAWKRYAMPQYILPIWSRSTVRGGPSQL